MNDKFKLDTYIKNGYIIKLINIFDNGASIHLLGPNMEKKIIVTYEKKAIKFAQFIKSNQVYYL